MSSPPQHVLPKGLPVEMHSEIVSYIDDRPTLLALLVSATSLHRPTERKLYESVRLSATHSKADAPRLNCFTESITAHNSRRAHFVNHLTFDMRYIPIPSPMRNNLDTILSNVVNLKSLDFCCTEFSETPLVIPAIRDNTAPFKLDRFALGSLQFDGRPSLVSKFITNQTSLTYLSIPKMEKLLYLEKDSLPSLRVLEASPAVVLQLLPGRPHITDLKITEHDGITTVFPPDTLRYIRAFYGAAHDREFVDMVSGMDDLEYLEVGMYGDDIAQFLAGATTQELISRALESSKSTKLRRLRMYDEESRHTKQNSKATLNRFAQSCFESSPSLESIEAQKGDKFLVCHRGKARLTERTAPMKWGWGLDEAEAEELQDEKTKKPRAARASRR